MQEEPRRDAGRQGDRKAERKHQPIGPCATLEDQDVAEAPVAHKHRRQRRHDGELDDERRQQDLLGGEELRALH